MKSTAETRALANAVIQYINDNPEKHDQGNWFTQADAFSNSCGTSMCIAGTALALRFNFDYREILKYVESSVDGFSGAAAPLLGLDTEDEKDILFYEMDNESALQKLKKVAVGEQLIDTVSETVL